MLLLPGAILDLEDEMSEEGNGPCPHRDLLSGEMDESSSNYDTLCWQL